MSEFTVELRIYGKTLDTSAITDALGLEPSLVQKLGDRRGRTTCWEEEMWAFNGRPKDQDSKTWESLEEGLVFVIEKLSPVRSRLESYKREFKIVLWCGHFQSEMNSSFTLSPNTLRMLGDLGVEVFIDNYMSAR